MSTSKRFGRLSKPLFKGARAPDYAAWRRAKQKKSAARRRAEGKIP